jgi:hypothetical protein
MNPEPYLYNETLLWTMTTNGYKYLTLNLIRTIQQAKCPWRLLVVAADRESYTFFRNESLPVILFTNAPRTQEIGISRWGSPQFQRYNQIKLLIAHEFAQNPKIKRCVYMDGDITLFNDFLPEITMRLTVAPEVILFQCDQRERGPCTSTGCTNVCTGFIAWAHGHDQGVFDTSNSQAWGEVRDDQVWVNKQLQAKKIPYVTLPRGLYPNGAYIDTVQELPGALLLHYNHRVGNAKILEMKRLNKWIIPYL